MKESRVFDAPLRNPDDDLLGMEAYARKLAEFIQTTTPPFTIGIYGEWGAGKTSFVQFVKYFLDRQALPGALPVQFISFYAWPHKTSDQLWSALVLDLARELYAPPDPPAVVQPRGLRERLARLLASDALIFDAPLPPPGPRAEYEELLASFGQAPASTGTGTEDRARIDHEEALAALVKAALTSLGTLSPLVAGLRGLFGLDSKVDIAEVLRREKSQALHERILSVEKVREVFRRIFKKADGKRVCVFIDDLDRCMPDVALDLLEAIKIFLEDAPCTFLVAADENLIGQGLRLRFKTLLEADTGRDSQVLFARKGQEYFEKIIQLGIRVPQPTPKQTHRFIAAQFPEWLPATDIIRTAIGDNPRRLKQYCNLLRYKYLVTQAEGTRTEEPSTAYSLLEKIFTLYSWKPECLRLLQEIAQESVTYAEVMRKVEEYLQHSEEDKPLSDADDHLKVKAACDLYRIAVESAPLFQLFREPPFLSEANVDEIAAFSWLADLAPHSEAMLRTEDVCFMRILEIASRQGSLSPQRLLQDDLTRLSEVYANMPDAFPFLEAIARSGEWLRQMVALETQLEAGQLDQEEDLDQPALDLLRRVRSVGTSFPESNTLLRLFLQAPRLSSLLPEEALAFAEIRDALPKAETLVSPAIFTDLSGPQRDRTLAVWAADNLPEDLRKKAERGLTLRVKAARYLLDRRIFAKLDAFSHRWPELAQRLRTDRSDLIALEAQVIQPQPLTPQLERWWDYHKKDEQVLAFLKLRPLFRDIDREALQKYFKVAQVTEPLVQEVVAAAPPEARPQLIEQVSVDYENVFFQLKPKPEGDKDQLGRAPAYTLLIRSSAGEARAEISLPWEEIDRQTAFLREVAAPGPSQLRNLQVDRPFESLVRELGEHLYTWFFQDDVVSRHFSALLEKGRNLRLLWDMEAPELMSLPLECLYIPPPVRTFPALTRRYSFVRYFSQARSAPRHGLVPPIRLLAVLPQPTDTAPLNAEGEEEVLYRSLSAAVESGHIQIRVLKRGFATRENLQESLRSFQPHLLHYVGHGVLEPGSREVSLVIEKKDGTGFLLPSSDLPTLLRDAPLRLAVLNACDTGTAPNNDAITGLAGALIGSGIPATIGTLRAVADEAALMFTREFYRSFIDGYPIEAAIIEARKALSVEKWDWSLYSLFTSLTDLSSLRLITEISRQERRSTASDTLKPGAAS
jgi:hypothetical protein